MSGKESFTRSLEGTFGSGSVLPRPAKSGIQLTTPNHETVSQDAKGEAKTILAGT